MCVCVFGHYRILYITFKSISFHFMLRHQLQTFKLGKCGFFVLHACSFLSFGSLKSPPFPMDQCHCVLIFHRINIFSRVRNLWNNTSCLSLSLIRYCPGLISCIAWILDLLSGRYLCMTQDFHNRRGRSPTYPAAAYSQPEDTYNQDVISVVEKSMKRNTENVMRFLEGISSRLSQLELYCYNLDKSIGEMRSDLGRDHGESDSKLKAIEKHLQEVSPNLNLFLNFNILNQL